MKILIGVPTAEMARYGHFYDHLALLQLPSNSLLSYCRGQSPARGRNMLIQQAIDNECSHIFFLDDDVLFQPDLLMRLLSHDKDIVTGLYLMRNFPHQPIIFDTVLKDGSAKWHYLVEGESGLIPIVAAGLGACLIKIDVFKNLEQPWIRLGQLEKDHWCDDLDFFHRVRALGYQPYCDLDAHVGHMATVTIYPRYENSKWYTVYDTRGTGQINFPAVPSPELVGA